MTLFADVRKGTADPIQDLNKQFAANLSPDKVDLGAGVYRNEEGQYHHLNVIKKAKQILTAQDLGHDYNPTTGIPLFCAHAQCLVFGGDSSVVRENRIATVQTVAGTGAVRIGAALLARYFPAVRETSRPVAYVGTPTWVNYAPLFSNANIDVKTFPHLLPGTRDIDLETIKDLIVSAPERSIIILQAVCHNPTGIDYTRSQWRELATLIQKHGHFAFFDAAYLGFGTASQESIATDVWPIRHFANEGVDMLVAQSFSKNLGLYSERVGALHLVCQESGIAERVLDQLRLQIRWEVSSSPAYGAHLASIVLGNEELMQEWKRELEAAVTRMSGSRSKLHSLITEHYHTPGSWDFLLNSKGLFALCELTTDQVNELIDEHHVYLPPNGRINVAGLSEDNIHRVAKALDAVSRKTKS